MSIKVQKILVPIDFSDISLGALDHAGLIARTTGASINILHIMEPIEEYVGVLPDVSKTDDLESRIRGKLEDVVKQDDQLQGINFNYSIKKGKIHNLINETAKEQQADLIVMGTHGSSGIGNLGKFILGSNAYRVVHGAGCSVITIREKKDPMQIKEIVLPLDITKETRQKVALAIEWAKQYQARVHVVSVSTLLDEYMMDKSKIKFQLNNVADEIKGAGVEVAMKMITQESIANSVMEYADSVNADLMIIMTRQEAKWNELFVGSSARKVISEANVPVMSVRPQEQ